MLAKKMREERAKGGFKEMETCPQIPVLRMAMVTSPGWRAAPVLTLSAVGSASLIQRSWAGLV
jgi:hypothetical protein